MNIRRFLQHLLFWLAVFAFYSIYFGFRDNAYSESTVFIGLLLPLSCVTTYVVLYWLIPRYLFSGRYARLLLYFIYLFLLSLYAEFSLVVWLFVANGDFQLFVAKASIMDLMDMIVGLYLVVFIAISLHLTRNWQNLKNEIEHEKGGTTDEGSQTISPPLTSSEKLEVRSERTNRYLLIASISYIESLGDYVIIHSQNEQVTTKRTLTSLEKQLAPFGFARVHRSYLVRIAAIEARTAHSLQIRKDSLQIRKEGRQIGNESVQSPKVEIPIGRSYRKRIESRF